MQKSSAAFGPGNTGLFVPRMRSRHLNSTNFGSFFQSVFWDILSISDQIFWPSIINCKIDSGSLISGPEFSDKFRIFKIHFSLFQMRGTALNFVDLLLLFWVPNPLYSGGPSRSGLPFHRSQFAKIVFCWLQSTKLCKSPKMLRAGYKKAQSASASQ